MGKFNVDDIAELSYFMAFNMSMNRAQRGKGGCSLMLREGPSMIFISQPAEHIHCGLDKDGKRAKRGQRHPWHLMRWSPLSSRSH